MTAVSETVKIEAPPGEVFAYTDDIHNLGRHMTEKSPTALMGSRLAVEVLSTQPTGLGATYRYSGQMMGLTVDFSESVTKYVPNHEKVWRTVGEPRLLIMSSYEMRLTVDPQPPASSRLTMSIAYELPRSAFWRLVGIVLAGWFSRWCLRRMCHDAKRALETRHAHPARGVAPT